MMEMLNQIDKLTLVAFSFMIGIWVGLQIASKVVDRVLGPKG